MWNPFGCRLNERIQIFQLICLLLLQPDVWRLYGDTGHRQTQLSSALTCALSFHSFTLVFLIQWTMTCWQWWNILWRILKRCMDFSLEMYNLSIPVIVEESITEIIFRQNTEDDYSGLSIWFNVFVTQSVL